MSQENNNILKFCQLFVLLVSVIFLGFATLSSMSAHNFVKHAKTVNATITGVNCREDTHGPHITISYDVDDKNYQKTIYKCWDSWYEGKEISILYDVEKPSKVRIQENLYFQSTVFGLLGSLFLILTIIMVIYQQQMQSKRQKLITEGNRVDATIIGCTTNNKVKIYGKHPYQIEATYEDLFSKAVYHFQSHNIYHNPPNMLGMCVPVYVNPNNSKDYYMDLLSLRNQLIEKGTELEIVEGHN
ncbi:MAG: DUF3592 domain-containing protein [Clostridiales bacterium]|nr:DUF3592 domain-containing protein [Clostridiales bacterium]